MLDNFVIVGNNHRDLHSEVYKAISYILFTVTEKLTSNWQIYQARLEHGIGYAVETQNAQEIAKYFISRADDLEELSPLQFKIQGIFVEIREAHTVERECSLCSQLNTTISEEDWHGGLCRTNGGVSRINDVYFCQKCLQKP